jgi:hypothetical protein
MATGTLGATEKYWGAHEASLIVVGTLHPYPIFPWFDGWHATGTIEVEEVLFGNKPPDHIPYRYIVNYSPHNDLRAIISGWPASYREKGLWFLKPLDGHLWQGASDVGFAHIFQRRDFEEYIRRYKRAKP